MGIAQNHGGPLSKNYDQDARCAHHMNASRHYTEDCWALRHNVQDLIENGAIAVSPLFYQISAPTLCPLIELDHQHQPISINVIFTEEFFITRHNLLAHEVPQFRAHW